jgi:hypothetical protein
MKLIVFVVGAYVPLTASWTTSGSKGILSAESMDHCVSHAEKFITTPLRKGRAIERAMDHCALDNKVDDKNFVCPHYKQLLVAAFRRESTQTEFSAKSFCEVTETYVSQLGDAAKIPNMGKGEGFLFELTKHCQPIVLSSFGKGVKTLPARKAPDFWYALCMNQDCAHFLPSRTRWCKHDHSPTHSASVCEAVRVFAQDEVYVMERNLNKELDSEQVCSIYDDFVEDAHINVGSYLHVVHGTKDHPVPSPENKQRALDSARMSNEAKSHSIRDSAGTEPVKAAAAKEVPAVLLALVGLAGLWA